MTTKKDTPGIVRNALSDGLSSISYDADSADFVRLVLAGHAAEKGSES